MQLTKEKQANGANRPGWVSPGYSQSRKAVLDPVLVAANRGVCIDSAAPEMDAYKLLRAQVIQRTRDKGWNTVMITSPTAGEGKTITAVNLALTFAKEFSQTVLLVDADLRRQNVHRLLGLAGDIGLVDYLLDDRPLSDLIVWPGIEKLTVISGGRTLLDSAEILGSPRMAELVGQMKTRYEDRYILFDTAPVLQGADALSFAAVVDAILMVVQWGHTKTDDIRRAMELIPRDKFIGFALNRHGLPVTGY